MRTCGVCNEKRSPFIMNNKLVCLSCDDLMFDIEIECEEYTSTSSSDRVIKVVKTKSKTPETTEK